MWTKTVKTVQNVKLRLYSRPSSGYSEWLGQNYLMNWIHKIVVYKLNPFHSKRFFVNVTNLSSEVEVAKKDRSFATSDDQDSYNQEKKTKHIVQLMWPAKYICDCWYQSSYQTCTSINKILPLSLRNLLSIQIEGMDFCLPFLPFILLGKYLVKHRTLAVHRLNRFRNVEIMK